MPNSNSDFSMSGANGGGQKEPEQADFWNKFGNKNDTPSSAGFGSSIWGESKPQSKTDGSFGGFGGGNQEEEKEADGISDLYRRIHDIFLKKVHHVIHMCQNEF